MDYEDFSNVRELWMARSQGLIQPKDVVTWLIALVGIAATGFGIIHQIRKSLSNTLLVQRENIKQDYQLRIYKDFAEHIATWQDSNYRLGVLLNQTISVFSAYFGDKIKPEVRDSIVPSWRINEFNILFDELRRARDRITTWIDLNNVVSPHFRVFTMALLSSSIDENEAYSNLYPLLVEHMPIEVLSSVVFNPPSISEYELLKKTISAYLHVMSIERSYVADLETLAQNVLLGDIFDNTANIGYHVDGVARIRIETEEQFRGWLAYFQRKLDA